MVDSLKESMRNRLYSHLLDNARDIIIFMDSELNIIEANAQAVALYGYSHEEFIGLPLHVLRAADAQELIASQLILAKGAGTYYETRHRRKDQTTFPVEFSSREIEINGLQIICSIGRDISDRKRSEKELLSTYEELQAAYNQIEATTQELEASQNRLQDQNSKLQMIQSRLQESETRYRIFLNSSNDMVYLKDHQFRIIFANEGYLNFVKRSEEELQNCTDFDLWPAELAQRIREHESDAVLSGRVVIREVSLDGRIYEVRKFRVPLQRGHWGIGTIIRDITVARNAQSKQAQLERIVSHSKTVAFVWRNEPGWPVELVSENIWQFGYRPDDFTSGTLSYADIIHEDDRERVANEVQQYSSKALNEFFQDYRIYNKAGKVHWINDQTWIRYDDKGAISHFEGLLIDISQRKEMEMREQINRSRLESLVELSNMQPEQTDKIIAYVMDAAQRLTLSSMSFIGLVSPDETHIEILDWSRDVMAQCAMTEKVKRFRIERAGIWSKAVRSRMPVIVNDYETTQEAKLGLPNGHVRIQRFLSVPIFDGSKINALVVVANKGNDYDQEDVNQLSLLLSSMWIHVNRKSGERLILEDRERLKVSLASIGEGIIVIDMDYHILSINPASLEIMGRHDPPAPDVDIRTILPLKDQNQFESVESFYGRLLTNEKVRMTNLLLQAADGTRKLISATASPVLGLESALIGHVILLSDITEMKRHEAHMILAQKLESIGQLAAGIAHEINTPMQYIGDNFVFLRDSFQDLCGMINAYRHFLDQIQADSAYPEAVQHIRTLEQKADLDFVLKESQEALLQSLEGIEIVNQLVRAMREFSHTGSEDKGWHDLNQAIDSTIKISHNQWKYWATMETAFEPLLPMIHCIISQINQVILNMIVNAAQAIEEKIKSGQYSKGNICIRTLLEDQWAVITIEDNGGGIPPLVEERIFDPFFTTKEVGKGTGQGLAIAHDIIVNKHGGRIEVKSDPGRGTRFMISLPIDMINAELADK